VPDGALDALSPPEPELTLVLRGDVAAMLWFAASRENPGLLSEAGVLGALLLRGLLVAGTRNTRFLRLIEGTIPRLAA
jgi:site-specific DNA recombinase